MTVTVQSAGIPSGLVQPLAWTGMRWPEGDADALAAAGDDWLACSRSLGEQRTGADASAARVWTDNGGSLIDAYQAWWTAEDGPSQNLARAVDACQHVAVAFKGLASQVSTLKAAYTAELNAMVSALSAGGFLVGDGAGGVAVRSGGEAIINQTRAAMQNSLRQAEATTTGEISPLVRDAKEKLKPAPTPPTRPGPTPGVPKPRLPGPWFWVLQLIMAWLNRDPNRPRRCPSLEPFGLPTPAPHIIGNADPRVYPVPSWIIQIKQTEGAGAARTVTIDGVIQDPLGVEQRQGYESKMNILRESIGVPGTGPDGYHGSHLWGQNLGTEAAAGILLAPGDVNTGVHADIERELGRLHQSVQPGGHVLLHATVTTYGTNDWSGGPTGLPAGANLVRSVDYAAIVCRPDGTMEEPRRYGYDVGLPTGNLASGTFRAGTVTSTRGLPARVP